MKVWGITGLMGSGKSTALGYLKRRGLPVVDADQVARDVVDPATSIGQEGLKRVLLAFGDDVRDATTGGLDRRKLRNLMASSTFERDRLEKLLHPLILDALEATAKEWEQKGFELAFVEGSRLVESGYADNLAGLIVITAPAHFRVKRVMLRDRVSWEDAEKIMKLQNEERLLKAATRVWDNDKDPADLEHQIEDFLAGFLNHDDKKGT